MNKLQILYECIAIGIIIVIIGSIISKIIQSFKIVNTKLPNKCKYKLIFCIDFSDVFS